MTNSGNSPNVPRMEAVSVGQVDNAFLDRVERYQKKKFQQVGTFDPDLFREVVERIIESDLSGEVEVLFTSENVMHDDTTSGLLIFKCNGGKNIFALAGLTDHA